MSEMRRALKEFYKKKKIEAVKRGFVEVDAPRA